MLEADAARSGGLDHPQAHAVLIDHAQGADPRPGGQQAGHRLGIPFGVVIRVLPAGGDRLEQGIGLGEALAGGFGDGRRIVAEAIAPILAILLLQAEPAQPDQAASGKQHQPRDDDQHAPGMAHPASDEPGRAPLPAEVRLILAGRPDQGRRGHRPCIEEGRP